MMISGDHAGAGLTPVDKVLRRAGENRAVCGWSSDGSRGWPRDHDRYAPVRRACPDCHPVPQPVIPELIVVPATSAGLTVIRAGRKEIRPGGRLESIGF